MPRASQDDTAPDRLCSKCGEVRPITEFYGYTNRAGVWRKMAKCKACHAATVRDWQRRNPENKRAADRRYASRTTRRRRMQVYGLAELEMFCLEGFNEGRCLICNEPSEVIDHDHESGAVRGMLCSPCNLGLGAFRDDPIRLARAIRYLKVCGCGIFAD